MNAKYYAVRKGKKTGIFRTWNECKEQVAGFSCAEYKSFKTEEEAMNFLGRGGQEEPNKLEDPGIEIYVDGSYNKITNEFSYGMVVLEMGEEIKFCKKFNDYELAAMHNVAGEIKGAEAAMQYAVDHGIKNITIYHDYEGIAKWCLGDWKTNKDGTKAYKAFYDSISNKVAVRFQKVTGHSNDKYNDMADLLAKQALGIM